MLFYQTPDMELDGIDHIPILDDADYRKMLDRMIEEEAKDVQLIGPQGMFEEP